MSKVLPRDEDGELDYNMLDYFFEKHGDLSNYGTYEEILKDLSVSDPALYEAYKSYIGGGEACKRLIRGF